MQPNDESDAFPPEQEDRPRRRTPWFTRFVLIGLAVARGFAEAGLIFYVVR